MLTNVRDNALRQSYAVITDFDGMQWLEYPLAYCDAGKLLSQTDARGVTTTQISGDGSQ